MRGPLVRIVDASLGPDAHVRLVVSRVSQLRRLRSAWSSSGALLEEVDGRVHATTTVEALARAAGRSLERDEARRLTRSLRESVAAWDGVPPPVPAGSRMLPVDRRPLVMGIVNVTPDSFADGGHVYPDRHPAAAIDYGEALAAEGADILDVGGESTRPGAEPVDESEERARVLPVVEALAAAGLVVSIDTRKAGVARAALEAGASIVNDTSAASSDALLQVVADAGVAYVLMHARGTPSDMQTRTDYGDVVAEVYEFLADALDRCAAAGIDPTRILIDPGIGFAKTAAHNLALLSGLRQFRGFGRPVLVGASRKSFLGELGGGAPDARLAGSLACAALGAGPGGVSVVRVHDVGATVQALRVARAIRTGVTEWPSLQ